jgi:hypothetical protein
MTSIVTARSGMAGADAVPAGVAASRLHAASRPQATMMNAVFPDAMLFSRFLAGRYLKEKPPPASGAGAAVR